MNKSALKIKMLINNDTGIKLAKALGISETTLSAKLNGKAEFTRKEIQIIKIRYNLNAEEVDEIFFNYTVTLKVTKMATNTNFKKGE